MKQKGFSTIELIIAVFLVLAVIAIDIIVIWYLNLKSRDIAVLSDIKQIQSGLDLYLDINTHYPLAGEPINLNDAYAGTEKLCADGFKKNSDNCSRVILSPVPNSDLKKGNIYKYQSADGLNYKIEFNLKTNFKAQNLSQGLNCATNSQILSQPCF